MSASTNVGAGTAHGVRAERWPRMRDERCQQVLDAQAADTALDVPAARCVSFLEDIPAPIFAAWRETEVTIDDSARIAGVAWESPTRTDGGAA